MTTSEPAPSAEEPAWPANYTPSQVASMIALDWCDDAEDRATLMFAIDAALEQARREERERVIAAYADIDMGVYPKAWEGKYESRTERMEGWNEAVMEYAKHEAAVASALKAPEAPK